MHAVIMLSCNVLFFVVVFVVVFFLLFFLFFCLFFFAEGSYYLRGARNCTAKAMVWPVSQHMDCDLL